MRSDRAKRRRRPEGAPRTGFTLLELLCALAVGALVLAAAQAAFVAVGDGRRVVARLRTADDAARLPWRTARLLAGRAFASPERAELFVGEPGRAEFSSWCDGADGSLARCRVSLTVEPGSDGPQVHLDEPAGALVVVRARREAALLYLSDPASGGRWFRAWGSSATPPLAIGVVADGDTTLLRIGERG